MTTHDAAKEPDKAVGIQLQSLRVYQAMSRDDAAQRLGVAPSFVEAIENGDVRPQPALLLEMARIYGVPPSRVFDIAKISQASNQGAER